MVEVNSKVDFYKLSEKLIARWKKHDVFNRSITSKDINKRFVFIDGPPFVTGMPHYGTLLSSISKDTVTRYWAMKGYSVRRVWGWDCHGLPIEEKVSKKFSLRTKIDIENFGVANYVRECRNFITDMTEKWRWYIDSIGRWVDMDNAYYTMNPEFNESVLWVFKQAWEKGYIYKGKRVSLYSTDSATPVSDFEVAESNNYQVVDDLSIFVKFKITNNEKSNVLKIPENTFIVAWTTTPWTIPSNFAIAVNEDENYVLVKHNNEFLLIAEKRCEYTFRKEPFEIINKIRGNHLVGLSYERIYNFFETNNNNDFKIYGYSGVTMEDGTGVLHIAPGFGEEDFNLGKQYKLSDLQCIDEEGKMIVGEWKGIYLRDANKLVSRDLKLKKHLLRQESYRHRVAFFRGENPLIYKAQDAYFIDMNKIRDRMLELNQKINWIPAHLQYGRFADIVKNAPDWCISRTRYWATIMPLWKSADGEELIIGSIEEMSQYNKNIVQKIENGKPVWYYNEQKLFLHRDICDQIILTKDNKEFKRVPDVLDCWLDSGSVPFAEYGYPFQNKEIFEHNYPADFITEYVGQTRAWFNVLLKVSTIVFDDIPVKNILTTGNLSGTDGRKMSKSFNNYPDPEETIKKYGGDALRLYLLGSPLLVGNDICFNENDLRIQIQETLLPLWNIYQFLSTYANINNFFITKDFLVKYGLNNNEIGENPSKYFSNKTNKWLINKLVIFNKEFINSFDNYNIPNAIRMVREFVSEISKWYIRVNRDSFSGENRPEFLEALSYTLLVLIKTIAPVTPFISEEIYLNLLDGILNEDDSIHLTSTIAFSDFEVDQQIIQEMELTREIINLGNEIRGLNGIKSRQPLQSIYINRDLDELSKQIILKELNIKEIVKNEFTSQSIIKEAYNSKIDLLVKIDILLSPELFEEGAVREITRLIQSERKNSGKKYGELVNIKIKCNIHNKNIIQTNLETISKQTNVNIVEIEIDDISEIIITVFS
jgi:isoleucyl-tRNA synthetase